MFQINAQLNLYDTKLLGSFTFTIHTYIYFIGLSDHFYCRTVVSGCVHKDITNIYIYIHIYL
jgi:hypothetical protein